MEVELWKMLSKALVAAIFAICAFVSYKRFASPDSKIKLWKFSLSLTIIVLSAVAIYSLTVTGISGYWFIPFSLTAYIFVPKIVLGLFVGSAVGGSVRAWSSGGGPHKKIIAVGWSFIFLCAVVYGMLWKNHDNYQSKNRVKSGLALEFVKNNSEVIRIVGANATPQMTSNLLPKDAATNTDRPLPIGYVVNIGANLYAIVSTPGDADEHKFTLDCISTLTDSERYKNENLCK